MVLAAALMLLQLPHVTAINWSGAVSVWDAATGAYLPVKCKSLKSRYTCYRLNIRVSGTAETFKPKDTTPVLTLIANNGQVFDVPTGTAVGTASGFVIVTYKEDATGITTRLLTNALNFGAPGLNVVSVGGEAQQYADGSRYSLARSVAGGTGAFTGAAGVWEYNGTFTSPEGLFGFLNVYVPKPPECCKEP
ncbi:hypothetical protein Rsub_02106 [Raphidocelis subcapitata]|uniref:Dirigent protein n=1 Tax=Raphidocelis subcapitata TaxID=307507 RepID=A0A2V0NPM7_9CHLO|nr:hypothetical protein Rsub_02106 [Raphidocelis subcapitata]|eukprot:GBF89229.1 hypothetical protein Rsub_02106 [Raphidocelis subcapitata]